VVGIIMRSRPSARSARWRSPSASSASAQLFQLGKLMGGFYLTCIVFMAVVLAPIARWAGFSLWKFLKYIRGGDPDRDRDLLFRVRAAAHDRQARAPGLLGSGGRAGRARPATRSTWTARRST
jgi:hypothetical protein